MKMLVLFVVLHNPVNNVDSMHEYGVYESNACYAMEDVVNAEDSPLHIELNKLNIELVETHCD